MATLVLCGSVAFSQSQLDAYKYGQTDLNGTARYVSMGGAFGALGGDVSVMNSNPAGLAIYRSSEVVTTLSLLSTHAGTNWLGMTEGRNKTKFNFDNIAYVGYFPTSNDEGVVSWNAGFSFNRLKNFHRDYSMSAGSNMHTSLTDYVAARAYGNHVSDMEATDNYNPYNSVSDWLSVLGYNAGFIDAFNDNPKSYYSAFGDNDALGNWAPYSLDGARLTVSERGAIDRYNIAFGLNVSNRVFFGATLAVTDISYNFTSRYDEWFTNEDDLYMDNELATEGSGYAVNVGLIYRPVNFLRLGVAYNSPTWYKMTDYFYGEAGSSLTYQEDGYSQYRELSSHSPEGAFYEYRYRSPDRYLFSVAGIIGQSALLSVDYELTNYKGMRMYERDGRSDEATNGDIRTNFGMGATLRLGAEVKVTPRFVVRAGAAWSRSPMNTPLRNGRVEVMTVGTIPHFTLDKKSVSNYTMGIGYRFTPHFYTDLACVLTSYEEDVYAFSSMFDDTGAFLQAQPATLKIDRVRMALTLGYKF
jgi:hypothetical protein